MVKAEKCNNRLSATWGQFQLGEFLAFKSIRCREAVLRAFLSQTTAVCCGQNKSCESRESEAKQNCGNQRDKRSCEAPRRETAENSDNYRRTSGTFTFHIGIFQLLLLLSTIILTIFNNLMYCK